MSSSSPERKPIVSLSAGLVLLALMALLVRPGAAQDAPPTVRALVTGYGAIGYSGATTDEFGNDFTATLAPVTLFQVGSDLLVEGELEVELEESATEIHLEHAQIHYVGFDHFQLTAGMGHLPFGFWKHANWVNKMPTEPLLFEDTHGNPAANNLMPIPFDLGVRGEANFGIGDDWMGTAGLWVSQGPAPGEAHVHDDGAAADPGPESSVPSLGYGANFSDNNSDKMVGVRLRAVSSGGLMLQGSGFRARYDDAGDLSVRALSGAGVWAPGDGPVPLFDLRLEGIVFDQEFVGEGGGVESVTYSGYYAQISRRFGDFEPVVRWGQLPRKVAGGGVVVPKRRQLALGINYVMSPSVPLKVSYNIEDDRNDTFFIEWAVGF